MTREEFIKELNDREYSYELEGNKIVINYKWMVVFNSLETIPPGVVFKNQGAIAFNSLKTIPPGVEFDNKGLVIFRSLISGGGSFREWKGNIEGIDYKRLLNKMISIGLFDRK